MNKFYSILLVFVLGAVQASAVQARPLLVIAEPIRLSEPVESDAHSETFGAQLNIDLPIETLSGIMTKGEKALGSPFLVKTRISKVCQKKGCFFIAQEDQHVVRVSFRDYGFFIPTDSNGKTVTLAGELVKKEMTEAQAEHFNSDLNDKKSQLKAGVVYEIVADSVKIPRS